MLVGHQLTTLWFCYALCRNMGTVVLTCSSRAVFLRHRVLLLCWTIVWYSSALRRPTVRLVFLADVYIKSSLSLTVGLTNFIMLLTCHKTTQSPLFPTVKNRRLSPFRHAACMEWKPDANRIHFEPPQMYWKLLDDRTTALQLAKEHRRQNDIF